MLLSPIMRVYTHDWTIMANTIPALIAVSPNIYQIIFSVLYNNVIILNYTILLQADHSEKMSILTLIENLENEIHKRFQLFSLIFEV